jgi:hypothetical protein
MTDDPEATLAGVEGDGKEAGGVATVDPGQAAVTVTVTIEFNPTISVYEL